MIKPSNLYKVTTVQQLTGCTEAVAVAYLISEEWDVTDAIDSYRADMV
jgi:hypothetical protein